MNQQNVNVLIIDDDPVIRNLLHSVLGQKLSVFVAASPSEALKTMSRQNIDIAVCDFRLPEMNGIELLHAIKEKSHHTEMIMISSDANMDTVIEAMRLGVTDFLQKPLSPQNIWMAIERTKKYASIKEQLQKTHNKNKYLNKKLDEQLGNTIIGENKMIKEVMEQMEMVAQTPDTSVLIIGESGTGKELVARGIHNISSRKNEFFGAVNMSAVPESLFESEFFGYKKGSFTGANQDKAGWFETAHGGSLFFDEIGDMDMQLQVKLLRVIEDRTFVKIGTQKPKKFDIRFIAATNKSIEELSDGKTFRLDLFHRLGTFIITLPPLRERREDIGILTQYFVKTLGEKMGKRDLSLSQDSLKMLNEYNFPGNIRELKNLIERAIILCRDHELKPAHFAINTSQKNWVPTNENHTRQTFNLEQIEKNTIIQALQKTDYNKSEAAKLLNLDWNALFRRIKKHQIHIPG
ncbi:MAG: sigma-54-dependent transcriptional regulator [Bacteroidales bacterium]